MLLSIYQHHISLDIKLNGAFPTLMQPKLFAPTATKATKRPRVELHRPPTFTLVVPPHWMDTRVTRRPTIPTTMDLPRYKRTSYQDHGSGKHPHWLMTMHHPSTLASGSRLPLTALVQAKFWPRACLTAANRLCQLAVPTMHQWQI
jgi:hypothetical protein